MICLGSITMHINLGVNTTVLNKIQIQISVLRPGSTSHVNCETNQSLLTFERLIRAFSLLVHYTIEKQVRQKQEIAEEPENPSQTGYKLISLIPLNLILEGILISGLVGILPSG